MSRTGEIELLRDWFKKQLGTKEDPPGSNRVWYNTLYWGSEVSGRDYAWCVVFQWCAFFFTGLSRLFYDGKKAHKCSTLKTWAKKNGTWHTSGFREGDLVMFNFSGGSTPQHIGWIDSIAANGTHVFTFEGNTSSSNNTSGGRVEFRYRPMTQIVGVVRPPYDEEEDMDISKLTKDQLSELKRLILPTLTGEELYGLFRRASEYAGTLPAPDWSVDEYAKAMAAGVTDGTRPQAPVTRLEAALMAYRAGGKITK